MSNAIRLLTSMIAGILFVGLARAEETPAGPAVTLHVGDPAPALLSASFVKGEPVKSFDPGKSYIVEFWATWCGPCRASIPHLSKLQEKYKDITFIGQNCWENDDSLVKPFVAEMGDKMNYRVAMDDTSDGGKGKMASAWMAAAGQRGIPTAFLIDGAGKIVFIGHPMELEDVLPAYVAGTFDAKKVDEQHAAFEALDKDLNAAMSTHDADKALAVVDQFCASHPDQASKLAGTKYMLLVQKKDYPAAIAYARTLTAPATDNANLLNEIAWSMVDPDQPFDKPDLDLALKLAQRASELNGDDPGIADTLAHVYAAKGDMAKAIEIETGAVAKADGAMKAELQKSLDAMKAKAPVPDAK